MCQVSLNCRNRWLESVYSQTNPKKVHPHLAIVTVSVVLRPKEGLLLLCGVCSMASAQSALGFSPSGSASAPWLPIKSARVWDSRSDDVSALSCPFLPRRLLDKRSCWINHCVLIGRWDQHRAERYSSFINSLLCFYGRGGG